MNEPVSVWRVTAFYLALVVFAVVMTGICFHVALGNLSFGVGLFLGGAAILICGLVAVFALRTTEELEKTR